MKRLRFSETQIIGILKEADSSATTIRWNAPQGARNTCSLYVAYSINSGSQWVPIAGPIPYNHQANKDAMGTLDWLVPNVTSSNCYLRIIASDVVDNYDTLISHQFAIDDCFVPSAEFTSSKDSGDYPLAVQFYDQSTWDPTSWYWDFGDGETSVAENPQHTYDTLGLYTVSHTATNSCGTGQTDSVDMILVTCEPVQADFWTPSPTTGPVPLGVSFLDLSIPSYPNADYFWDFGDGGTSDVPWSIQYTYTCPVHSRSPWS